MNIKKKFLLFYSALFLLLTLISMSVFVTFNNTQKLVYINQQLKKSSDLFIKLQFFQSKFLMYKQQSDIDTHKLLIKQFTQNLQSLSLSLDDIEVDTNTVKVLNEFLESYNEAYKSVVKKSIVLGLSEIEGLHGQLRNVAHEIEIILYEENNVFLLKDILELRRNEKDYIQRHDEKYFYRFQKNIDTFLADIKESKTVKIVTKEKILRLLESYKKYFTLFVEAQKELGLSSTEGLLNTMHLSFDKANIEMKRVDSFITSIVDEKLITNQVRLYIFFTLLFLLVFVAVYALKRNLLDSLKKLATLSETSVETFTTRFNENDELGRLANKIVDYVKTLEIRNIQVEEKSEKLNNALEAKDMFLANMSHELRTPLNAILGFMQLLSKDEEDNKRKKIYKTILSSGKMLLDIINDILDFSKIESGKIEIEKSPFYIQEEMKQLEELFGAVAKEKKIKLKNDFENSLPECVVIDAVRYKQVLLNLIGNAIKFTNSGGGIVLNIKYSAQKGILYSSVKDNGIGIAEEKLETIFESFSQEDSSTTRKFGGTGLGLTISSQLVELMGGKIKVKSQVGEGSKFYFEIPTKECPKTQFQDEADIGSTKKDGAVEGHILIVEDNKTNQLLLSMILEELNLTYEIANNGQEAVSNVKQNRYDLILMDENMPVMNGIEAVNHIRLMEKEDMLPPIPIVAVTANALGGAKEKFLDAGMNDYISKPYTQEDIVDVLKKYLS